MAKYQIPFVDQTVDTSNPSDAAASFGKAVAGIVTLGAAALIGQRIINAGSEAAGSDSDVEVV
jgi:hypothetical protein